ncbi:MAG: glycosyltransferase family 2 protein [Solirubrobacteraceae bacterium]
MDESHGHTNTKPLVSIGIPTYQRVETLRRAIDSALAQSYTNIEVVICDDGSSDATQVLCRDLSAHDGRVRYLRSPTNLGLVANHNKLFAEMHGQYVMMLCDDDWLEASYVERCLAELKANPDHILVCGAARYLNEGEFVRDGVAFQLTHPDPATRIRAYLKGIDENGLLYGLMPRTALIHAAPMRNVLGNDWLLVMAILAQGKARTVQDTAILRELDGTSADFDKLTTTLKLPRWQARIPHLVLSWQLFAEIGWRAPVYRSLSLVARTRLAMMAAWASIRWRSLVWHMTMPTFAMIGRRAHGGLIWRAYSGLARLLGGNG